MESKPKKSILVLLAGSLWNDSRVLKISETLADKYDVTIWCYNGGLPQKKPYKVKESYKRQTILHRILNRTLFWLPYHLNTKKPQSELLQTDLVWANDLPTLYTGAKLARKLNAKLIYDSHEIYLATINQFFPSNTTKLKKSFHRLNCLLMQKSGEMIERKYGKFATHVFTANDSFTRVLKDKYQLEKTSSLYNMPVLDKTQYLEHLPSIRSSYSGEDILVLYHGKFGPGRGLELIIDSFQHLPAQYKLVMLGSGVSQNTLETLVEKYNIKYRVQFIPMVPENELIEYIQNADVGINILENINQSKWLASPNKLFQYIHAGIPVVCSKAPENLKAFEKFKMGELVDNDPISIARGIQKVIENSKTNNYKNIKAAAEHFSWEKEKDSLTKIVKGILSQK